jgi:hypothetical protein
VSAVSGCTWWRRSAFPAMHSTLRRTPLDAGRTASPRPMPPCRSLRALPGPRAASVARVGVASLVHLACRLRGFESVVESVVPAPPLPTTPHPVLPWALVPFEVLLRVAVPGPLAWLVVRRAAPPWVSRSGSSRPEGLRGWAGATSSLLEFASPRTSVKRRAAGARGVCPEPEFTMLAHRVPPWGS